MTAEELLIANITKAHNMTADEVTALIYDTAEDGTLTLKPNADAVLYDLEAKRAAGWKSKITDTSNKVANEKTAQINAAWEQRIRDGFGITDDLKGEDLFNKAVEAHKAVAAGKSKDKNSPEYIELEMKAQRTAREYAEFQAKINSDYVPKSEVDRRVRLYDNNNYAEQLVAQMKFIPDEDPVREQTKRKFFKQELANRVDDVQIIDGKRIPFKDGQRIENSLGNPIMYDEIVKEVGMMFWPVANQTPKGNADPNKNPAAAGQGRMAELQSIIDNPATTSVARLEALKELRLLQYAPKQ
jgi:hypothetical protein